MSRHLGRSLGFALLLLLVSSTADGRSLTDVFTNELAGLELEPLGDVLANTVASTYPVASASSSVSYRFNPELGEFERTTGVLAPLFGERAETVGKGEFDVSLTYSYVDFKEINGQSLGDLVNKPVIDGRFVTFEVPGGLRLADERRTTILPVLVQADIDVDAHIFTPGVTYGLTGDLDVNLTIPLIRTHLGTDVLSTVPDPRLPSFALVPGHPVAGSVHTRTSDSSFGIGDVLLRLKYVFLRQDWLSVGTQVGLSFPTGDKDDLQGTGDWRVLPQLIASGLFYDRIQPIVNVGFDINASDIDKTSFRWAVGATGRIWESLNGSAVFLGRNEFGAQADRIQNPFFFQIERNDVYDVSLGLRWAVIDDLVLSGNAILPLNDEGLRADVIPTFQIEYFFSSGI